MAIEVTVRVSDDGSPLGAREKAVLNALGVEDNYKSPGTTIHMNYTKGDSKGDSAEEEEEAPTPKQRKKPGPKPKAEKSTQAAVLEEPDEPDEPDEPADDDDESDSVVDGDDDDTGEATLEDAIALARKAVNAGQTAKVKASLAKTDGGAASVRKLTGDDIGTFVTALSKEMKKK